MPELPEVETVKRRLAEVLAGKTIRQIKVLKDKSFQGEVEDVLGAKIISVQRKAKLIRLQLDNELNLLVHLKMTGQLIYQDEEQKIGGGHPTADWVANLPGKHTRIIFYFREDGAKLFFNDMRIFGWIKVLTDEEINEEYDKYGPDVIDAEFTPDYLKEKVKNRRIAIKQAIMINKIVGGVGNIYACEALFLARIDPRRPSNSLKDDEYEILVEKLKQVIAEGIAHNGTTFDGKYVGVDGLAGSYQKKLKVYGQKGEACPECGGKVKKIKVGGRGTYFCEECQR